MTTTKDREPGFYWVRFTYSRWFIAEWTNNARNQKSEWVTPHDKDAIHDSDFQEIGPRIPSPTEPKGDSATEQGENMELDLNQGEKWYYHWSYGPSHRHTLRKEGEEFYLAIYKDGPYSETHKEFGQSICDKLNATPVPTHEEIEWEAKYRYAEEVEGSWNPIKREAFIHGAKWAIERMTKQK